MAGFLAESGKRIVAVAARLNLRRHVGAVGACTGRTGPPAIVATKPGNPGAENVGAVEADVRLIVVRITASKAKAGQVDVDPVPVEQGERNGSRKTFEVDLAGATTLAFGSANIASPGGHEISVLKFETAGQSMGQAQALPACSSISANVALIMRVFNSIML